MKIVIHRPPAGFDEYGDPMPGASQEINSVGCVVAPRTPTEVLERGRNGVIDGLTLYGPHTLQVEAADLVEIDGVMWEVEGQPGRWATPAGVGAGVEVPLRRALG